MLSGIGQSAYYQAGTYALSASGTLVYAEGRVHAVGSLVRASDRGMDTLPVPPEAYITFTPDLIDADGKVTNPSTEAFLRKFMEVMGWQDLNWLEDVHMGYEEGEPAIFDRNCNGWVRIPKNVKLPANQQDRDMMARELLVKFQMSPNHPMVELNKAYRKF